MRLRHTCHGYYYNNITIQTDLKAKMLTHFYYVDARFMITIRVSDDGKTDEQCLKYWITSPGIVASFLGRSMIFPTNEYCFFRTEGLV